MINVTQKDNINGKIYLNITLKNANNNDNQISKDIVIIGYKKEQPSSNEYSILFNSNYQYNFGENNSISNINEYWIKEKIILNKDSIFSINGKLPNDFSWENNLYISIIQRDLENGKILINVSLLNANNQGTQISNKIEVIGFKKEIINNDNYEIIDKGFGNLNYGDYSLYVDEVNELWIKNKIFENKEDIFIINGNLPSTFNWEDNLSINIIEKQPSLGVIKFTLKLININNNGDKLEKIITFSGFKPKLDQSDDSIIAPENPDIIPPDEIV